MISQIKVPARWRDTHPDFGHMREETAVFNLGLGPCGKTVVELEYSLEDRFLSIIQICSDTERKIFIYRVADLIGRIEVTYV